MTKDQFKHLNDIKKRIEQLKITMVYLNSFFKSQPFSVTLSASVFESELISPINFPFHDTGPRNVAQKEDFEFILDLVQQRIDALELEFSTFVK